MDGGGRRKKPVIPSWRRPKLTKADKVIAARLGDPNVDEAWADQYIAAATEKLREKKERELQADMRREHVEIREVSLFDAQFGSRRKQQRGGRE